MWTIILVALVPTVFALEPTTTITDGLRICPRYERYDRCPPYCPLEDCLSKELGIKCPRPPDVPLPCPEPRCVCIDGYLRNNDGVCIPEEKCSTNFNVRCGPNQVVSECAFNCSTYDFCPKDDTPRRLCSPPFVCHWGCICRFDHRIDKHGNCIPAEECPRVKCTRPNEVYNRCPSACLRENCEDKDDQPTTCNTLIKNCDPRCICKKGYFRNKKGICVPYNQCPKPRCPVNEEWVDCVIGQCKPKWCSDIGRPQPCPRVRPPCPGGCLCVEGYLRNDNGLCVPIKKCPCKGDPNAELVKCPDPCPSTCSHPKPILCKKACIKKGCQCKKGYVLGPDDKCIKLKHCPVGCGSDPNAELVTCPHPCPGTCSHPEPIPCKRLCVKKGCQCKKGYVLGPGDKCIKLKDCPNCKSTLSLDQSEDQNEDNKPEEENEPEAENEPDNDNGPEEENEPNDET